MKIPISKIQMGDTQTRVEIDLPTVSRYAELNADGVVLPAVDIYEDQQGAYRVADGYHRIEAVLSCGGTEIEANVHKGSRDDALWAALAANRTHGLPMSRDDKRHAVEMALRAFSGKSNREIARQVGCGDQLVATVRQSLESNCVITQLDKTVGADGKARTVRRDTAAYLPVKSAESYRAARYVRTFAEMTTDELRRNFNAWRDQMEGYATLEHHRGKTAAEIAVRCGMPLAEIELILNPRPPVYVNRVAKQEPAVETAVQQHNEAVENHLLHYHSMRFNHAAFYAEQEGAAETARELRAIEKHYDRQMKGTNGSVEFAAMSADKTLWVRAFMLGIEAYRAAIGLDREPRHDEPQDYLCAAVDALDYGVDDNPALAEKHREIASKIGVAS